MPRSVWSSFNSGASARVMPASITRTSITTAPSNCETSTGCSLLDPLCRSPVDLHVTRTRTGFQKQVGSERLRGHQQPQEKITGESEEGGAGDGQIDLCNVDLHHYMTDSVNALPPICNDVPQPCAPLTLRYVAVLDALRGELRKESFRHEMLIKHTVYICTTGLYNGKVHRL